MPVPRVEKAVSRPSGGVSAALKNLPSNRERVQNVNRNATELLMELNSSPKAQLKLDKVRELLENVRALTNDLSLLPLHDWQQELQSLRNDLSKEIHDAVKAATEPPSRMGTATWAQGAARAPAPAHQLSLPLSSNATSAAPITTRDRDVIICLNSRDQVNRYRGKPSEEMKDYANKVRAEYAKDTRTATLATVMVKAVRQLKSGDLRLTVRDAREAQVMRLHRDIWVRGFGSTAFVHMPTWGAIVHGVQVRSLVDKPTIQALREAQGSIAVAMVAENSRYWGKDVTITKINWLRVPKEGAKLASVILEFSSPKSANKAIEEGVLWDSNRYQALLYDRGLRVRQCFNCQQFGHIGTSCADKTRCVYCTGEHQSRDCTSHKHNENSWKCANCGGAHAAWSEECPARVAEIDRLTAAAKQRPRFHPVPAEFSYHEPSVSLPLPSLSSMGTPQVSSTEETTSGTTGSAVASAARSSNGEQRTSATRTSSGIQGKSAKKTVAKAPSKQTKKAPQVTVEDKIGGLELAVSEVQQETQRRVTEPHRTSPAAGTSSGIQGKSKARSKQTKKKPQKAKETTVEEEEWEDMMDVEVPELQLNAQPSIAFSNSQEHITFCAQKPPNTKKQKQCSEPARKRAGRRSERFINKLESANQKETGEAEETEEAGEVDFTESEKQLKEDLARSDTNYQPSSLPDMTTRGQKRKQPVSESELSYRGTRISLRQRQIKATKTKATNTPTPDSNE
ncbi:hypothetical protein N7509_000469 [Penicillium cosmopolitanum]|uniref:CCHC-type domain-containing protein n=1 Tax=Penicillium cosmopolitanum TaxID=1131564 RepID=A0A9W9WAM6_9EURO|nr:uncharacterized protein N7509_000469 [Penicillium cosmopolitanum]KAJ5413842.1 hypothetical protein N7509_000469 [Penicillium cosmopolitanum]